MDNLGLLDVLTYDEPNLQWVIDCNTHLDPTHDSQALQDMLDAAVQMHNEQSRLAFNHLIEWLHFESKPGLSKTIDRTYAPTRDGAGLWSHVVNLISKTERQQQIQFGSLWADIHARSYDLDGKKGTDSPFPDNLRAHDIQDIIAGIGDTWANVLGNNEANASDCIFTILRLLQRRADTASFAREQELHFRRKEAAGQFIDLTISLKHITDELDVIMPQLSSPATGNAAFDSAFGISLSSSEYETFPSLNGMHSNRSRPGIPRSHQRTDDTRGGQSRTSPRPGDGRAPRTPMNRCKHCTSKLCSARPDSPSDGRECVSINSKIPIPTWATKSNERHLGLCMRYFKDHPGTTSIKAIDVVEYALNLISAPMLKRRGSSADINVIAPILENDEQLDDDPELEELANSDALRAIYEEQGTAPSMRLTSSAILSDPQSQSPADPTQLMIDSSSHASDIALRVAAHPDAQQDSHDCCFDTGRMHSLLSMQHGDGMSPSCSMLTHGNSESLDHAPRIVMLNSASCDHRDASDVDPARRPLTSKGFGRGNALPTLGRGRPRAPSPSRGPASISAKDVIPPQATGAAAFSQSGRQRPAHLGQLNRLLQSHARPSSAALAATQRMASQRPVSAEHPLLNPRPRITRVQQDEALVRVRKLFAPSNDTSADNRTTSESDGSRFSPAYVGPEQASSAFRERAARNGVSLATDTANASLASASAPAPASNRTDGDIAGKSTHTPASATLASSNDDNGSRISSEPSARTAAAPASSCAAHSLHVPAHGAHNAADHVDMHQRIDATISAQESLASRLVALEHRSEKAVRAADVQPHVALIAQLQTRLSAMESRCELLEKQSQTSADRIQPADALRNDLSAAADSNTKRIDALEALLFDKGKDLQSQNDSLTDRLDSLNAALCSARAKNDLPWGNRSAQSWADSCCSNSNSSTLPDMYRVVSPVDKPSEYASVAQLNDLADNVSSLESAINVERDSNGSSFSEHSSQLTDLQQSVDSITEQMNELQAVSKSLVIQLDQHKSVALPDYATTAQMESLADSLGTLKSAFDTECANLQSSAVMQSGFNESMQERADSLASEFQSSISSLSHTVIQMQASARVTHETLLTELVSLEIADQSQMSVSSLSDTVVRMQNDISSHAYSIDRVNCAVTLAQRGSDHIISELHEQMRELQSEVALLHDAHAQTPFTSSDDSSLVGLPSPCDKPSSPSDHSYVPLSPAEFGASPLVVSAARVIQACFRGHIARTYRTVCLHAARKLQAGACGMRWRAWYAIHRDYLAISALHAEFRADIRAEAKARTPTRRSSRVNLGVTPQRYGGSPSTLAHFGQPASRV